MAITFINSTSYTSGASTGTSFNLDVPTHQAGDILIAIICHSDDNPAVTLTPPSGWTLQRAKTNCGAVATSPPVIWIYWREATDSEPAYYTWGFDQAGGLLGICACWRGVDATTPFTNDSLNAQTGTGTDATAPSVDTAEDGEYIIAIPWSDDDETQTTPSGMTLLQYVGTSAGGNGAGLGSYYELRPTAGSTGTRTSTLGAAEERSGVMVSLNVAPTGPTITDVDTDEDIYDTQTNVICSGSNFGASQTGSADIEIGDNSDYASCTYTPSQSVDSWSDTSIQFDVVMGSLSFGTNYVFVTDSVGARNDPGFQINIYDYLYVTNVNPSTFRSSDTGVVISGEGFGASQGLSKVYLADQSDGGGTNVQQTIESPSDWSATSITFTVVQGALTPGTVYVIVARNQVGQGDSGERFSNGYAATLLPPVIFKMSLSTQFDEGDTTKQLSDPASGNFSAGRILESTNPPAAKSLQADEFSEYEWCMQATADAQSGAQYEFRIKDEIQAGEKLEKYTVTPKVTLAP